MDTLIESATETETPMTEAEWQVAHTIAQTLVQQKVDVNELGKAIAYLRFAIQQNPENAGTQFFKYLKTLVSQGKSIGHSGKTPEYYRNLDKACSSYLQTYQTQPLILLHILGWTARLIRYYKEGGVISEPLTTTQTAPTATTQVQESERQAEIRAIAQDQNFQVGQQIEATVKSIKGKEVTYELPGGIKLTVKEPKKCGELSVGQSVQVEILELRENGTPKKVKWVS
ncbi:hypothetical protein [Leptolyngbya sp. O-77]|uniref:hypothetical protein n=1 Tax=Leptolyngbya sp. O-77 TaxID=1080068 RepID=UPI00074D39F6|nr:hypothetical protein [Leptolyngbya sp. O-77]BAU44916.1 hypothetical protein O77CONTIG1_04762 [Leptolyngbya sp. O-77]